MITINDDDIKTAMQGVIDEYLKPKFIELGMNASGKWLENLQADAVNGVGYIRGLDYTFYLANGRKPNQDQSPEAINHFTKWAGFYIFTKWVKDKGISANPYAVARAVAMNGTRNYPSGTDLLTVLTSKEVNQYLYTKINAGVAGKLRLEIQNRVYNTIQQNG